MSACIACMVWGNGRGAAWVVFFHGMVGGVEEDDLDLAGGGARRLEELLLAVPDLALELDDLGELLAADGGVEELDAGAELGGVLLSRFWRAPKYMLQLEWPTVRARILPSGLGLPSGSRGWREAASRSPARR
jgi:hypothetical protein